MQKKQVIDKKITVKETFEITDYRVRNAKIYLKISTGDGRYKWIDYNSASENSEIIK